MQSISFWDFWAGAQKPQKNFSSWAAPKVVVGWLCLLLNCAYGRDRMRERYATRVDWVPFYPCAPRESRILLLLFMLKLRKDLSLLYDPDRPTSLSPLTALASTSPKAERGLEKECFFSQRPHSMRSLLCVLATGQRES